MMKTVFIALLILILFMALPLTQSPIVWFSMGDWLADCDWVGLELLSSIAVIIAIFVVITLISLGIFAAVLMALFAGLLALLFNSAFILLPLGLILLVYWLVTDKKAAQP
ncbi:hypothetical protein [Pseudoalteromonas xiamenensis]